MKHLYKFHSSAERKRRYFWRMPVTSLWDPIDFHCACFFHTLKADGVHQLCLVTHIL